MEKEALFKNRTPEAAARQLAIVLVNLLECEMATLERLADMKSTSKKTLERHRSIVKTHMTHLVDLGVDPETRGLRGTQCGRVRDAMRAFL